MPVTIPNPYTGEDDQTCSVSFQAQQQMAGGVRSPQTEAQYNASKLLGEWGVIKGKVTNGQIPNGTKVLTYTNAYAQSRGYIVVSGGKLVGKKFPKSGPAKDFTVTDSTGENFIQSELYKVSIPRAVGSKVAAATPATPVDASSTSVGSMSHEDVAAMFVKIKDDLAKEKGLNIKGANPALDEEVYKAIAKVTGYTPAEVRAKIDAYKALGNKLSALKKKVLAGTKQVPTGNAAQRPATGSKPLLPTPGPTKSDPKPHGVPTVATNATTNAAKQAVKQQAAAHPTKVYSDEDVASAYIIAKDKVVAASNGKWTLYSKNDELDKLIYAEVKAKTGFTDLQAKQAIANYLASGKKLSQLKKALAKQGAFKPEADTLKKSGSAKTQADKEKEIEAKADAGYTPTPTPAAGTPPKDIGKPAPVAVKKEAERKGDITGLSDYHKNNIYTQWKEEDVTLFSSPEKSYGALVSLKTFFGNTLGVDYTLLQLLRVIDERNALAKGQENDHKLEKKMVGWLTGSGYQTYKKEREFQGQESELAQAQPPLPADSGNFKIISPQDARNMHHLMQSHSVWTTAQSEALRRYTGNKYSDMNEALRKPEGFHSEADIRANKSGIAGMRPIPQDILLHRGAGSGRGQFGIQKDEDFYHLAGKLFEEKGFLSTSVGGKAAFSNTKAIIELEVPAGTLGAYVKSISRNAEENELILKPGTRFRALRVDRVGQQFVIRMRVESQ